jgi:hypothetical protein
MTKRMLSILILSFAALVGPASSGWAQRQPPPPGPKPPPVRVTEPGTALLLLTGVAASVLVRRVLK